MSAPPPFVDILDRCERMSLMHLWIQSRQTAAERKSFIMSLHEMGTLTDLDITLLIECYELEAA